MTIFQNINQSLSIRFIVVGQIIIKMKNSDQFTSPASFLKKQSHIITNNAGQEFSPHTPTSRFLLQKQMHRSHFHSEANTSKFMEAPGLDESDLDMYCQEKQKVLDQESIHNNNPNEVLQAPFDSFYQQEDLSSDQERSCTKSQKKIGFGQSNFKEHALKKVSSNQGDGKFLFINSKKQKYNNNTFLFQSNVDNIRQEITKYEISIEKLKEENLRLRSQKIKLSSSNQSMQLIELRLELQAMKKRIKQLETEKQMHLTINQNSINPISISPFEANSVQEKYSGLKFSQTRQENSTPLQFKSKIEDSKHLKMSVNSPSSGNHQSPNKNYRLLQNIKSPYFLKKN